ncbi:hypothetical protein K788_0000409 [Paraburkholderia caribensis MBA4]|uniref:Uncharacterized protein n=2 Tax=Paraburkholderia caribensis TaxID=75105 RepID=A0A0P0RJB4_9BURK|nr:hypothetical protein K788_0000409 [Paraburkholderia caribensis MBA4]
MEGPIVQVMDKRLYQQMLIDLHKGYFHILAAERRRLLDGILKGVELDTDPETHWTSKLD